MKKVISLAICLTLVASFLPQTIFFAGAASSGTCGENLKWSHLSGILTISGTGDMSDFSGFRDPPWKDYRYNTGKVVIENGVTSIGNEAFSGFSNLKELTIGNSVASIGNSAFYGCESLTSATIPDSVTSIGAEAFSGCTSLWDVTIGNGVSFIGNDAFYNGGNLNYVYITDIAAWCGIEFENPDANPLGEKIALCLNNVWARDITIPDGVTSIGKYAFKNYEYLEKITIPPSVTYIGSDAFYGCDGLYNVSITDIAAWCAIEFENSSANPLCNGTTFYLNGSNVADLIIPSSVTSIGEYAFYNCDYLTSIIIPSSVTSIGEAAFRDCLRLKSVIIPQSVTSIASLTFAYCRELNSITIPLSVTSIGSGAFNTCPVLKSVNYSGSPEQFGEISIGSSNDQLNNATKYYNYIFTTEMTLDKTATTLFVADTFTLTPTLLPEDATLKEVKWRSSDTSIAKVSSVGVVTGVAPGVATITAISKDGESSSSCEVSVLKKETAGDNLIWGLSADGILKIGGSGSVKNYWEEYIPYIKEIVVESGISNIYYEAFYDYVNIEKVTLPETLTKIYGSAFEGCSNLTTLNLPSSLAEIEDYAFSGCEKISDVYYADSSQKWGTVIIGEDNGNLLSADCHFGIFLAEGMTLDKSDLEVFVGNTETLTPVFAPANTTNKSVTWSSSDSKIAKVSSAGIVTGVAPGIATVTATSKAGGFVAICTVSVPHGTGAYGSLSWKLDANGHLTISGVGEMASGTMPWSAFTENIRTAAVENGVFSIAPSAFANCANLASVSISDSVVSIGDGAFSGCSSLVSVKIPKNVTEIAATTFENCSSLEEVSLFSSVTAVRSAAFSGCDNLTDVYFDGTEAQWNSISIRSGNNAFKNATVHCEQIPFAPAFSDSMSANLTLEANVFLNIYFMLENLDGVDPVALEDRVGLLVWDADSLPSELTYENCSRIIRGAEYSTSLGYYKAQTDGIPAKELGDAIAFRPYFINDDGSYTYGRIISNYCPSIYCYRQLQDGSTADDELMITILNYGAAAQEFFNYRTDSLMNKDLTDAQKALNWDESLVRSNWSVPASKAGTLVMSSNITMRAANLTLLGAIDYNYYITIKSSVDVASAKILCWTEADYNATTVLTKENASLVANMEYNSTNKRYEYKYAGLPAKEMFSPIYTCAVIADTHGNEFYGGVVAYCPERFAYISTNSNVSEVEKNLAKRIAIYGNAAKKFFQ